MCLHHSSVDRNPLLLRENWEEWTDWLELDKEDTEKKSHNYSSQKLVKRKNILRLINMSTTAEAMSASTPLRHEQKCEAAVRQTHGHWTVQDRKMLNPISAEAAEGGVHSPAVNSLNPWSQPDGVMEFFTQFGPQFQLILVWMSVYRSIVSEHVHLFVGSLPFSNLQQDKAPCHKVKV